MDIKEQSTYYFNNISTVDINKNEYERLNNFKWTTKNIVIKKEYYVLDFLIHNDKYYLKSNTYYCSKNFDNLFNITIFNWYFKGKIMLINTYN